MATLSPSELAALLGPIEHHPVEHLVAISEEMPQWDRFSEQFAHELTARLRPLVRAAVRVQPSGCRMLTAEAANSANDPRSLASFWQSNGSLEPLAMVLTAPLVTTFVDRLLGGRAGSDLDQPAEHRPLTDVDRRLAMRLIDATQQSLMTLAGAQRPLELNDVPPHATSFVEAWLPDCSLLQLVFELRFVQGGGTLELLLPLEVANTFVDDDSDLKNEPPSSSDGLKSNKNCRAAESTQSLRQTRSAVVARLARTELAAEDLRSLAVGDVLLTDAAPGQSLEVLISGQLRFRAEAGALDGHKAVRLLSKLG